MKNYCAILLTGLLLLGMVGCSLIQPNEERDRLQTVAEYSGGKITKGEYLDKYDEWKEYNQVTPEIEKDPQYAEAIESTKKMILDQMVTEAIEKIKIKALGFDKYSAEDQKNADDDAQKPFDEFRKAKREFYEQQNIATPDKKVNVEEMVEKDLVDTLAAMKDTEASYKKKRKELFLHQLGLQRMKDSLVKDVTVADKEVATKYETEKKTQETTYKGDPSAYENAVAAGEAVLYELPDYGFYRHILIAVADTEKQMIAQLRSGGDEEGANKNRDTALAKIKAKADDVLKKAQAVKTAEEFEALITAYGSDPGMKSDTNKRGYAIGPKTSAYMAEFMDAARKLKTIGAVSGLVATDYGYHIIRKNDVSKGGNVPFNDVKVKMQESLLKAKKATEYTAMQKKWETELNVKKYYDRLVIIATTSAPTATAAPIAKP